MGIKNRLLAGAIGLAIAVTGAIGGAAPAQAAVPDGHGFVLWNGAAIVPDSTWPPVTDVAPVGTGV
jgi:hypothetical protein